MTFPLLRKEWLEHRFVLLGLLGLLLLALRGLWWQESELDGGFQALSTFVRFTSSVGVLFLANRLVAREYGGRTQIFLETLPLTRQRVLLTKWSIGALLCLAICALSVLLVWWWQSAIEVLSATQAFNAFARCALVMLALWSFAFTAAMLGRFRYLAWMVLVGGVYRAIDTGNATLAQVPVLQLTTEAYSAPFPAGQALAVVLIIAGLLAAALVLGLWGEGSIASALAARMTTREWVTLLSAAAILITVGEMVKADPELPPFALEGADAIETSAGPVAVQVTNDDERDDVHQLTALIAGDVETLARALQVPRQPGFFVIPRVDLDGDAMQRARLSQTDGVVVQANLEAKDFEPRGLSAHFMHEMLADYTRDRALTDDAHWFLDGLAAWWSVRERPDLGALLAARAAVQPQPLTVTSLRKWMKTTEQLGWCSAEGASYLAVQAIAELSSAEQLIELARDGLQRPSSRSLGWLLGQSFEKKLKRHTGLTLEQVAEKAEALRLDARVSVLPTGAEGTSVALESLGGQQRALKVHLGGLDPMTRFRVSTVRLEAWDDYVAQERMSPVETTARELQVPETFSVGDVVLVTVDSTLPSLECRVRTLSERVTIR